jgi:protoporphyrinogen oxidase
MQTTNKNKVRSQRTKTGIASSKSDEKKSVAIIGGGIVGLVLGYLFSKRNFLVTMYEKDLNLGGLVQTSTDKKILVEKYYHHFFKSDRELIDLLEELGLQKKIIWHESSVSFLKNGSFYKFDGPRDLFTLPFIGLLSKIRFGLAYIFVKSLSHKYISKSSTADQMIKKIFGMQNYTEIWCPMLKGKFHTFYNTIAASWFVARIKSRSSSRGKTGEYLGYLNGSFQTFTKKISKKIVSAGGIILLGKEINSIEKNGDKLIINKSKYDIVIATSPNITKISEVKYLGSISVILKLKNKLTDYYWTNILDEKMPFKVIVEQTNLVSPRNYHGSHIVYLGEYIDAASKRFRSSDKEIEKEYLAALSTIFPAVHTDTISCDVYRTKIAQPITTKDYAKLSYNTDLQDCYEITMAHIYPEDRGMNYAIKSAKELVRIILDR